jgi:NAD+ diphosphatase
MPRMPNAIAFAGSPLDRASAERRDRAWLRRQLEAEATRFLPLWRLQPLIALGSERRVAWARRELFADLSPAPEPILLGLADGVAHFAVDVSAAGRPDEELGIAGAARFEDLRAAAATIPAPEAAVCAQARSLVDWHGRHRHCAACGGATRSALGGAQRVCADCAAEHFPRTDPVAISVVARGDRCLLGRSPGWPVPMYSALAGFVEPGETLEEAVRREVQEEAGVRVGAVRYLSSQPWPFPSSLMIGCLAEAESEEIRVDPVELEDAAWFRRDAVLAALAGAGRELVVPPPFALAHHLIRAWAEGS